MLVWCCFLSRSSNLNLDKRVSSWNLGCSLYTLTIVILGLDGHVHDSAWSANTASVSKDMHELSQNFVAFHSCHASLRIFFCDSKQYAMRLLVESGLGLLVVPSRSLRTSPYEIRLGVYFGNIGTSHSVPTRHHGKIEGWSHIQAYT